MTSRFTWRRRRSRLGAFALASVGCVAATGTANADLAYGIEMGVGHSDNIGRVAANEQNETIGIAGFDLNWTEGTRRLEADVTADLSYYEYIDDTFESELLGTADGSIVIGLVPERFTWLFQDSFGQTQVDPFAASTPATRENINYFTTGPDFILRLGSAASLRLFGRYSATEYEESALDADRIGGGLAIERRLSSRTEIGLNAVTEQIDFDAPDQNDYDRQSAFLSYELRGGRTDIDAQLGYTWLDRGDDETEGGALVHLLMYRDITSSSRVYLSLGTQLTNTGDALRSLLQDPTSIGGGSDIAATADPFERRTAGVGWSFVRNRTTLGLSAGWNEERYETQTALDRTSLVYGATATRELSRTLELGLLAAFTDEEFDNTDRTSDELRFGGFLRWRPGRVFEYTLTIDRFDRDTSVGTEEYVENRALLTATYRPRGTEPGARRR